MEASKARSSAVSDFIRHYKEPVKRYLIFHGVPHLDAEDITQEIFMKVFEHKLLDQLDKSKGRFRSYMLAITCNILSNWRKKNKRDKRGGGELKMVSLDAPIGDDGSTLKDIITAPTEDDKFDSLWMDTIMKLALDRLREECEKKKLLYFEAYMLYLQERDASYASVAAKLDINENQTRHYIHRAKQRLIKFVRVEIARYCSTEEEFNDEIKYLPKFVTKGMS